MPVLNQSMAAANQSPMAAFNQAGPSRMPAQAVTQWQHQHFSASDSTSANGSSRRPSVQTTGSTSASSMPTTAASLMREGPRDFTVIRDVGDGSFGTVCLADWKSPLPSGTMLSPMQHPTTRPEYIGKRLVAIKKMKKPFPNWEECMKLKELKSLLGIPAHPNIIPLYDAFLMPGSKELHFVFECMEGNLYQLTKSRKGRPLAGGLVASIFQQIVRGLHHIHVHGYFHRDMKPENLLITTTGLADYPSSAPLAMPGTPAEKDVLVIVKLADFGLARETNSKPPYTEYVSTRWYRAPEVLLRSRDYSNPVDLWALGTIMAEIVNLKPLFPGQSEVDQVLQICEVLGDPTREYGTDERGRLRGGGEWQRGIKMARAVGFEFPLAKPVTFSTLFAPKAPPSLIDCIQDLLRYEPRARLTTADLLEHHYYAVLAPRLQPPQARAVVSATTPEQQATMLRQMPREHVQSLTNVANTIATIDATAARTDIPPSHSSMPQHVKPAFGAGDQPSSISVQAVQRQRQEAYDHGAKDVVMGSFSPRGTNDLSDTSASTARDTSTSNYGAFPGSVSLQDSLQTSNAGDTSMTSPTHHTEMGESDGIHRVLGGLPNPSHSGSELNILGPSASSESIALKDRQRKGNKGWGLNISSVLGGGGGGNSTYGSKVGQPLNVPMTHQQQQQHAITSSGKTPAQQVIADHALTQTPASPAEAKKAKKAAEKAAREAEKAKRVAQEQAARERARAVMQKRNQMLASSNGRDQVEWLQFAENDMTRALQQQHQQQQQIQIQQHQMQLQQQQVLQQSASSVSLLTGYSDGQHGNTQQSMYATLNPPLHSQLQAQQSYAYQPSALVGQQYGSVSDKAWGKQPRVSHTGTSDNSSFSEHGLAADGAAAIRGRVRPREEDGYGEPDPRRQSMQSYHTRDSDPGPVRSALPEHMVHLGLRPETTSSLNSAPGVIDAASYRSARLHVGGDRSSVDTRSVASSLDNQLILNMENMTAVDSAHRGIRQTSPAVAQYAHGARPSYSRQSLGSRTGSAHRAGSASPLHHTPAPRFHPYSSATAANTTMASYSSPNVPLPPLSSIAATTGPDLMENLSNDGTSTVVVGAASRPRSKARRQSQGAHSLPRGISRGSATSRDGSSSLRHASGNTVNIAGTYIAAPPPPSSKSSLSPTPSSYYPYTLSSGGGVGLVGNMPVMLEGQAAGAEVGPTVLPPFSDFFARAKPINGIIDPIKEGGGGEGMNVP